MKVEVRSASQFDAMTVLNNSRFNTVSSSHETLAACFMASSNCWIGKYNNRPVCAWGLIPPTIISNSAYIWLLESEEVEKHTFLFVRHSQIWMEKMLDIYGRIFGQANRNNYKGIRWLKWLGAEFMEPEGDKISFVIRKKFHG